MIVLFCCPPTMSECPRSHILSDILEQLVIPVGLLWYLNVVSTYVSPMVSCGNIISLPSWPFTYPLWRRTVCSSLGPLFKGIEMFFLIIELLKFYMWPKYKMPILQISSPDCGLPSNLIICFNEQK